MVERKAVSKRVRFEVFKRDSFTCQYCGGTPPKVLLHLDHIVAVANGGTNEESNLITSCADCNLGKSSVPLSSIPQSVEDRAITLAEREEQLLGYQELMKAKKERIESEALKILDVIDPSESLSDADWYSAQRFVEQLGYHDVMRAAEIAYARGPDNKKARFKYFCGICHNWLRDGVSG